MKKIVTASIYQNGVTQRAFIANYNIIINFSEETDS